MKKLIVITIICMSVLMIFNGCGYRLSGHGKQVPDHIRTIYIPDFDNKTYRMQAERFVTYAVRDEFIKRSRLKLVSHRADADSVLEGVIKGFDVTPTSYGKDATANLYDLSISVSVRFIDLTNNKIIFEAPNITFKDSYDVDSYEIDDKDFFSQETEKLIDISEKFAESVVVTILENF